DRGEYACVASATEHNDIDVSFKRAPERLEPELSDDMRGSIDIHLGQWRHGVHGPDAPCGDGPLYLRTGHIRGDHAHAEGDPILARDLGKNPKVLCERRLGAG